MASQPRTCAPAYREHCLAKNDRNRALIADYLGGMSRKALSEKYGLHISRIGKLFWQKRVVLSREEQLRRRRACTARNPGRPPVWPDCPPELAEDYALLRRYYGANRARAMLDPGRQA